MILKIKCLFLSGQFDIAWENLNNLNIINFLKKINMEEFGNKLLVHLTYQFAESKMYISSPKHALIKDNKKRKRDYNV